MAGNGNARVAAAGMALALAAAGLVTAVPAQAAVPSTFQNCTNLNKSYPHGVGRSNARDKTSGKPVTTFRKDNALYDKAMTHNRGLDRDRDGIACERR